MLLNGSPCDECPSRKLDEVGGLIVDATGIKEFVMLLARLGPWATGMEQCISFMMGGYNYLY